MDGVDRLRIHRILEFVKSCNSELFQYDVDEVLEDMSSILLGYDIYDVLSDDEYYLLIDELLELAEQSEIAEAARWASLQLICGHDSMSDFRIPGYMG